MSRTVTGTGPTLEQALRGAVAELLACEPEKVDLRLDAPGLDDATGGFSFDLRVVRPAPEPAVDATEPHQVEEDTDEASPREGEQELSVEDLDEEADAAADFLEGLLDAMDLPGDLRIKVHADHAELEVIDLGSGALIGRRGQTLEAIQELVRCSLQRRFQRRARVKVDAEGYRARRLEKLIEKAEDAIDTVLDTGEPERLEPMDVFERKAIHQLVGDVEGVQSRSQGREPARRIVIERG